MESAVWIRYLQRVVTVLEQECGSREPHLRPQKSRFANLSFFLKMLFAPNGNWTLIELTAATGGPAMVLFSAESLLACRRCMFAYVDSLGERSFLRTSLRAHSKKSVAQQRELFFQVAGRVPPELARLGEPVEVHAGGTRRVRLLPEP